MAANRRLAGRLREYAELLAEQQADPFRIQAYHRAAEVIAQLSEPAPALMARGGTKALEALPAIGRAIAAALGEMIVSGRWSQLERLRGSRVPETLFRTIPGIGPRLAAKISCELGIENLAALKVAAYDGRLERLPGFGKRRLAMVRAGLNERFGRSRSKDLSSIRTPEVAILLEIDREFRKGAEAGTLPLIGATNLAPAATDRRHVLHTHHTGWRLTALYSNTRRALELGRTRDWVVIYYQTDNLPEDHCTVVTARRGPLAGRRVVRGRETECEAYYASASRSARTRNPVPGSGDGANDPQASRGEQSPIAGPTLRKSEQCPLTGSH